MHPVDIKDIPFFKNLSQAELDALGSCLVEKSFKKGELIHNEGSHCMALFFVRSGRIKIFRTSPDGRDQIFEVLGAGDTCACNPGQSSWHCGSNAEAVEESRVWLLPRENYIRLISENSKTLQTLNALFAKRLQCFGDLIEEVSLLDSRKRLVKFLLDMLEHRKEGIPKNNILFISSTREEIAQRLGTSRETIARQISSLKRKKLIDVKPYQIVILDLEGLKKLLQ